MACITLHFDAGVDTLFSTNIEGDEKVFRSTDLALKSAWIVDWYGKPHRFTDFENTVDRGSAVIFDEESGLCLLNEIWITNLLIC